MNLTDLSNMRNLDNHTPFVHPNPHPVTTEVTSDDSANNYDDDNMHPVILILNYVGCLLTLVPYKLRPPLLPLACID